MGDPLDVVRAAAAVLAADGRIGGAELAFLEGLGTNLKVEPRAVESVLDEVRKGEITLEFPEDLAERKRLFGVLVAAARADGEVAPEEERLLKLVAARLGVVDTGPGGA